MYSRLKLVQMNNSMKKILVVTFVSLCFCAATFGQALTAADYDRAVKMLGFSTSPLVDRGAVHPTFLPDGRFWYRAVTATGSEYVIVDPSKKTRRASAKLSDLGVASTVGG